MLGLLRFIFFVSSSMGSDLYTDTNTIEAARNLREIIGKPYEGLRNDADRLEWVRARLALISLERLRGREADALQVFEGCKGFCEDYAPEQEWKSVKEWGCAKNNKAAACVALKKKK